ncbi:Germin-like protein subfamily 3 member 4 [Striga hermonthica]|uniref:Germin-like protein n=1 Tax=Striga hermonthica TaxID=68872 RepID=A0A9N7R4Q3_STRHE|nr:Germin-like protein subfamily 3 member 4 [Striga hermonthica]
MSTIFSSFLLITCICTLTIRACSAGDPDNLFDSCPADTKTHTVFINGYPCKSPSERGPSDFKSSVLSMRGDTDNLFRSSVTMSTAAVFPGLNTLGLSGARIDLDVDGVVAPHSHPRASEIIFVRAGLVVAGFVDSGARVFQKQLGEGDVFLFPKGLLHYCFNAGFEEAAVFSVFNSQNPGLIGISSGLLMGNGSGSYEGVKMVVEKLKAVSVRDLDGVSAVELFGE